MTVSRTRARAAGPDATGATRGRWIAAAAALVVLAFCSHALILATPGFFSHDEWQKFDDLEAFGYLGFARLYGAIAVGPDFGYPVRPIGFLEQGVAAHWMMSTPAVAHAFGVVNHAIAGLLFAWVLVRAGLSRRTALVAAGLFIVSPLTTQATGWLGASFDQLYVVFFLLVGAVVVRLPGQAISLRSAVAITGAMIGALLSKETAVVAPAAVLILAVLARARWPATFRARPFAAACALVTLPVVAYLIYRAPAIAGSLHGQGDPTYRPSVAYIGGNVARYLAFPFDVRLGDLSGAWHLTAWQTLLALAAHGALAGAVARRFGAAALAAYLLGYMVMLLPVLVLPNAGSHYLYASAIPMSLALAVLLEDATRRNRRWARGLLVAGIVVLSVHVANIELNLYATGSCQARFLADLDTIVGEVRPTPDQPLLVEGDPGAPLYIADRATFQRARYQEGRRRFGRPIVDVVDADEAARAAPGAVTAHMTTDCTLRRR